MHRSWRWKLTSQSCLPHFPVAQRTPTTTTTTRRRPSTAHAAPCRRRPTSTSATRRGPTCQRSRTQGTRQGLRRLPQRRRAAPWGAAWWAPPWWAAPQAALLFLHLHFRLMLDQSSWFLGVTPPFYPHAK